MATTYEEQLVSQYGTGMQDFINHERTLGKSGALKGVNVDEQDVARITNAYQAIAPVPNAQNVYSTENITQAVTSPAPTPDLSDPLGIYDYYMGTDAMKKAQASVTERQTALQQAQDRARQQQFGLEQAPESMARIVGKQARGEQLSNIELQSLAEQLDVAQSAFLAQQTTAKERANIVMSQRDQLTQLITQNPDAGVTYKDTIESAASKISKANQATQMKQLAIQYPGAGIKSTDSYETAAKKVEAKMKKDTDDAYKKELSKMARELGVSLKTDKGGTRSTKQLEEAIAKKNKQALEEARAWQQEQMSMERTKFNLEVQKSIQSSSGGGLTKEEKAQIARYEGVLNDVRSGKYTREQGISQLISENFDPNEAASFIYNSAPNGFEQDWYSREDLEKFNKSNKKK